MEFKLKEIIKFKPGYAFKKAQMGDVGLNLIKIKSLKNNKVIFETDNTKIKEVDNLKEYLIFKDDILMALTGDPVNKGNYETWVGRTCRYTNNHKAYLNQRICKLIPNENVVNKWYLYYWLIRHDKTYEIASLCHGSANQANISHKDVGKLTIDLPTIEIQDKIVKILYSIDKKIELNNQINNNLYEIIKGMYNKFMNELSKYQIVKLKDLAIISSGKRPKVKGNEFEIPLVGASGIMSYTNSNNFDNDTIIIGRVGTLGVVQRYFNKIWASDNTLTIKTDYKNVIENYMKKVDYISLNRGSTQPLITQTDISNLDIKYNKSEFEKFESRIKVIREMIYKNEIQNKALEQLRDTLLPKLMSGKIDFRY